VKYSIVIPVYKSGAWLPELVERIGRVMDKVGQPFELILVNDASPDLVTWPAIEKAAAQHPWVRGVDLFFNTGQFRATLCGLSEARGEFVITMDDDLQHPPEEMPKLIEAMEKEPRTDCVFGRYQQKQHSGFRNFGTRLMSSLLSLLYDKPSGLETTSFRVMSRKLVDGILSCRMAHPQFGPMILRLTKNAANVNVEHKQRSEGRSGYRAAKLVSETFKSVINASTVPLRLVSALGIFLSVIPLFIAAYFLVVWITGGIAVAGFTSLILMVSFTGGLILFSIGILGEYIGRVIAEVSGPPKFIIRRETSSHV
jgi:glycosyltransferase involved in cell wall biosynthesis